MKYITVIQARTSSKRLPKKSLMQIFGKPLAVLCAERSSNEFSDLIVATSNEKSDDDLVSALSKAGILCYRGSLENVLERFISIIKIHNLRDNDVVIRLTADNPIVDKHFLKTLKNIWEKSDLDYMSAQPEDMKNSLWPKGLSAEFIRVKWLLKSYEQDKSRDNLEHVTKYVREHCQNKSFGDKLIDLEFSKKLSLSIDTIEEFNCVKKILEKHSQYTDSLTIIKSELNV